MATIRFANFTFDPDAGDLSSGKTDIRLRRKTAQLLDLFLARPRQLLTHDAIFAAIWPDRIVTDNTLMQSVRELRAAMSELGAEITCIETVSGRGYRWIGPLPENAARSAAVARWMARIRQHDRLALGGLAIAAIISVALVWLFARGPLGGSFEQDFERAQIAREQGEPELARRYYEAALVRAPDNSSARIGLATVLYELGEWGRAADLIQAASESPDAELPAALQLIAGQIALGRGEISVAEQHFSMVRARSGQDFNPVLLAAALKGLSNVYADQGRIADYLAVRAEAVDPLLVSFQVEAFAEGLLSAGSMVRPDIDASWGLERLQRALTVFEELGDADGIARAHAALGANPVLEDTVREQHLQTAMDRFVATQNRPGELRVLLLLASFEIERGNADAARDLALRGMALSDALGAARYYPDFVYREGLALMVRAQFLDGQARAEQITAAIAVFDDATRLYDELGVVLDGLAPQLHAAIAWTDTGQAGRAIDIFDRLIPAYSDLPFPPGLYGSRLGRAAALAMSGDVEQAERILSALEAELPQASPIVEDVRASFSESGMLSASLFSIIISAERQFSAGGLVSE